MHDSKRRKRKPRKRIYYQTPDEYSAYDVLPLENEVEAPVVGCTGKRRYPDLLLAHAAAHHMSVLIGSSEVYLYLCEHCNGYHLTKAPISPDGKLNRWVYFFGKDTH